MSLTSALFRAMVDANCQHTYLPVIFSEDILPREKSKIEKCFADCGIKNPVSATFNNWIVRRGWENDTFVVTRTTWERGSISGDLNAVIQSIKDYYRK